MSYSIIAAIGKNRELGKDNNLIWSAIAWADVKQYAEDILYALNLVYDDKYAILCDGKVIK